MSFGEYKDVIAEGDTVILYVSFNSSYPVRVTPTVKSKAGDTVEHVVQTTYGALRVRDLIGKRFGTKVRLSRGYSYALHPTPELWTKCLPHRTQILYATDISMILMQLELKPGSVVVESGTGSASLTHSLARTVAPTGQVYTFDFHQQRAETAAEEFRAHGIAHLVTSAHADACSEEGFGEAVRGKADAVFLDLPHPWDAVVNAKRAMKKNGCARLCSFSPCIEQVQRAAEKMREQGFKEISTIECLLREFQVRRVTLPVFDPERQSDWSQSGAKKRKLEGEGGDVPSEEQPEKGKEETSKTPVKDPECSFLTGLPLMQMPGHTGYLTFATLTESDETELTGDKK